MIALLLITALFVAISVYFYLRAESLQRSIRSVKREADITQKEHAALSKYMTQISSSYEDSSKKRLNEILTINENTQEYKDLELLKPLINNYGKIFRECQSGKGKLHAITKKCFSSQDAEVYNEFVNKIIKADSNAQRLWGNNNLTGFISLVELLLTKYGATNTTKS
jgi:ribosomal protein S18